MSHLLELKGINKVYENGIYANQNVDFSLVPGEIHALIGENGAGKSTLMKILYGMEKPDSGEIIVKGKQVEFSSPQDAMSYNIGMVHQHFILVESLSVMENVALGFEVSKLGIVDREATRKKVTETMKMFGLDLDPGLKISELSVALKQKVEIIKALYRGACILILDEPTAVLTPQETEELFVKLKQLKSSGITIIFISHKLREVMEFCDRCSIMRKGKMVATLMIKNVTKQQLSEMMIGTSYTDRVNKDIAKPGDVCLRVKNATYISNNRKQVVSKVSVTVRSGEIVGVAGVEGNGQSELVEMLFGLRPYTGKIELFGNELKRMDIRTMRESGVAYIPADRITLGLASSMSIETNMIATKFDDKSLYRNGLLSEKRVNDRSKALVNEFQISCSSPRAEVDMLSGGNMQKVVAAREFGTDVRLFIVEQPSRGIDVGTASLIHKKLVQMRDAGCAILLVTADLDELLKLSDSVVVMYEGKINAYFSNVSSVTETELGYYMLGVKQQTPEEISRAYHEKV